MRIPSDLATRPVGHAHFWERAAVAGVTRGQFLRRSAGTLGGLAGLTLFAPAVAAAKGASPRPIPGGIPIAEALGLPSPPFPAIIHLYVPGVLTPANSDPSTITDFNGHIAFAVIRGTGTGTGGTYTYECDMRLFQGVYIAEGGRVCRGSFTFL